MKRDKYCFCIFNSWDRFDDETMDDMRQSIAECNEMEPEEVTDEMIWEDYWDYLDDERANLDKETGGVIIALADLGFWFGRRCGCKVIGTNVSDILHAYDNDIEEMEWWADKYNVRGRLSHHDGSHYVLYRIAKNEEEAERICDRIYSDPNYTEKDFMRQTRSVRPIVANIYGWKQYGKQATKKVV